MKCISCFKEMSPPVKHKMLLYKDTTWCSAQSAMCDNACNWCYWYAWDNVARVNIFVK